MVAWSATAWGDSAKIAGDTLTAGGTDAPSFWRWLAQVRAGTPTVWLWQLGAGHGATTLGLWQALERGQWALDGHDPLDGTPSNKGASGALRGLCVLQEPPFVLLAKESHARGIVKWVDVRNLGVDSWKELYDDCGYGPDDNEAGNVPVVYAENVARIRANVLADWLQEWYATVDELQLGGLRHTAAAQAWHGWRHSYLEGPILVHAHEGAIGVERDSIAPGRNECFRIGRINDAVWHCDASAFYPGLASDSPLPGILQDCERGDYQRARELAGAGWLVIASGVVNTAEPLVPVRIDDETIYPVGSFHATYCWPEWELLIRCGATVSLAGLAYYAPATVCHGYTKRLWTYRVDCEHSRAKAKARCVKRLMNSLIGKFASWDWGWVDTPGIGSGYPYSTWYGWDSEQRELVRWRSIGWHVQKEQCNGESQDSCPAIASWVYSLGRVRMAEWIRTAGRRNCYYCDTDSLFCNREGYERLVEAGDIQDRQMGRLSLHKIHSWLEIWGLKSYATPDGIVCSGVSQGARLVTDGGFEFWHPETVKDSIRNRRPPRAVMLRYRPPENRPYRHGIVRADGTVAPHRLTEGDHVVDSDV